MATAAPRALVTHKPLKHATFPEICLTRHPTTYFSENAVMWLTDHKLFRFSQTGSILWHLLFSQLLFLFLFQLTLLKE